MSRLCLVVPSCFLFSRLIISPFCISILFLLFLAFLWPFLQWLQPAKPFILSRAPPMISFSLLSAMIARAHAAAAGGRVPLLPFPVGFIADINRKVSEQQLFTEIPSSSTLLNVNGCSHSALRKKQKFSAGLYATRQTHQSGRWWGSRRRITATVGRDDGSA
jgi:hypothetical protein